MAPKTKTITLRETGLKMPVNVFEYLTEVIQEDVTVREIQDATQRHFNSILPDEVIIEVASMGGVLLRPKHLNFEPVDFQPMYPKQSLNLLDTLSTSVYLPKSGLSVTYEMFKLITDNLEPAKSPNEIYQLVKSQQGFRVPEDIIIELAAIAEADTDTRTNDDQETIMLPQSGVLVSLHYYEFIVEKLEEGLEVGEVQELTEKRFSCELSPHIVLDVGLAAGLKQEQE